MKFIYYILTTALLIMFSACSYSAPAPIEVKLSNKKVSYLADVKPILDKRCVVCHSCYNSPCQSKFSSFEGIDRGGSKAKVYLAERLFAQKPSRLFIDANSTEQWRKQNFFSLTDNSAEDGYNNSIMGHMLHEKNKNPEIIGNYAPEYDNLSCPKTLSEVNKYIHEKKNHGMPYGFPALSEKEYSVMMQWLAQGSEGPSVSEQEEITKPSVDAQEHIDKFEKFLNQKDAKHVMTARYLYEHFFLAHINFKNDTDEFFMLVRSYTPSGQEIEVIATRRPYDDPKVKKFYYRFQKIHSTIVHKTHIVVQLADEEMELIQNYFIDTSWLEKPHVMSYDKKDSANPFITYAQIPPSVRYKLLLSDSEYFVRSFIRGPVCKGQIALNVIHDHFWVMFQDPKYDLGVQYPEFLTEQAFNLSMPIESGSSANVFGLFSDRYRNRYEKYFHAKIEKLAELAPNGFPVEAIWKGEKVSSSRPALNIYRHFDSASVNKGFTGELPRTMWVIDYAQFERIYYSLVAGFDVFGNVSHQTNIRRYMDFLRIEGEINFLLYMPRNKRKEMFSSWYIGDEITDDVQDGKDELKIGNQIDFKTDKPKQEFVEYLVDKHFLKSTNIHFDKVNYFSMDEKELKLPEKYTHKEDIQRAVRAITLPGTNFMRYINNEGANVLLLRINMRDNKTLVRTLVLNRWHDNVNSLFGEKSRRNWKKDTMDIVEGSVGSYPNVFMEVDEKDLPDFFDMIQNYKDNAVYKKKIEKYAISRNNKDFWKQYDWFQKRFEDAQPLESGLYDLNRYYKKTW